MRSDIRIKKSASAKPPVRPPRPSPPEQPAAAPPTLASELVIRQSPARSYRRLWLATAAIVVLVLAGFRVHAQSGHTQSAVTNRLQAAQEAMRGASDSLKRGNYADAEQQFKLAKTELHHAGAKLAARGQLGGISGTQGSGNLSASGQLLATGELLTQSAAELTGNLATIRADLAASNNDLYKAGEAVYPKLPEIQRNLADLQSRLRLLQYTLADSQRQALSGQVREVADKADAALPKLQQATDQAKQVADALPQFLGSDHFRQYLIWFQNPAELRATGGFIGTYGVLKVDGGRLISLNVDSIYNVANQANRLVTEQAPEPYQRFVADTKSIWGMQDANWSPNFPTSAEKFQQLYEKSGGPTTDGVIALTINPVVEILKVVGPIEMPEYDYTLNADTLQVTIQADQLSRSQAGDQDPKKILRDFLPKLLAKIGNAPAEQQQAVFAILNRAFQQNEIVMNFDNLRLQQMADQFGIAGRVTPSATVFGLVDTNIAGYKSSRDITTSVYQQYQVDASGQVTVTTSVDRRYDPQTASETNHNFSRLYLPPGSKVLATSGFLTDGVAAPTTSQADGFTVVGGWTDLAPGEQRQYAVSYQLPEKLNLNRNNFTANIIRQAGLPASYSADITLPNGYRWHDTTDGVVVGQRTLHLNRNLDQNFTLNVGFAKD